MAADYAKAAHPCDHPSGTESTAHGHYCLDCGQAMAAPLAPLTQISQIGSADVRASQAGIRSAEVAARRRGDVPPIDTSKLGPIKLDYAAALSDARHLNWRRIPLDGRECRPCPADRPFYVACPLPTGDRWSVTRVGVGELVPWEATHWCDDLLGLPACSD